MAERDLLILNCKYYDPTSEIGHICFKVISFNEEALLGKLERIKEEYYGVEWSIDVVELESLEDDCYEILGVTRRI